MMLVNKCICRNLLYLFLPDAIPYIVHFFSPATCCSEMCFISAQTPALMASSSGPNHSQILHVLYCSENFNRRMRDVFQNTKDTNIVIKMCFRGSFALWSIFLKRKSLYYQVSGQKLTEIYTETCLMDFQKEKMESTPTFKLLEHIPCKFKDTA